jgi:hypothetical protein
MGARIAGDPDPAMVAYHRGLRTLGIGWTSVLAVACRSPAPTFADVLAMADPDVAATLHAHPDLGPEVFAALGDPDRGDRATAVLVAWWPESLRRVRSSARCPRPAAR